MSRNGRVPHHECGLNGKECELIAAKLKEEEKSDPNRRTVLERVVLSPYQEEQIFHWGAAYPKPGGAEAATCLKKGRFRVRVEGWEGDRILPSNGWTFADPSDCEGQIVIAVWTPDRDTSDTQWGEVDPDSGHEKTYWVEYVGPATGSSSRRAGPFGCTGDPVDHAMEDGNFTSAGEDGGYVIFDAYGQPVEVNA